MEYLYEFVKYLAVFVLLLHFLEQLAEGSVMKKYVRFFVGALLCFVFLQGGMEMLGKNSLPEVTLPEGEEIDFSEWEEKRERLILQWEQKQQTVSEEEKEEEQQESGVSKEEKQSTEEAGEPAFEIETIIVGGTP